MQKWEARLLEKQWTWAGHVARLPETRWARRVQLWRGSAWREARREWNGGRLAKGFRTTTWRWDRQVETWYRRACGGPLMAPAWETAASRTDPDVWNACAGEFAAWALAQATKRRQASGGLTLRDFEDMWAAENSRLSAP